ncbi:small cell adhesion glycoprotein homolog [Epinephelus fuscoguttatus]|uniref:small cell adhesion glycoprotein homolog n=1 Tax=Epinephelus fuscoguttatus TaxID=293821 RepID=UPI0020CFF243|nr:small cell adhesion glycoprotein homolog [Epinephelus fuscoguttatus]XP_049426129.1 small cell adhesion glycoprotein homolog [Epinephelus fuscoguttatus]
MDAHTTPAPGTLPLSTEAVTKMVTNAADTDGGDLAALIGGIVVSVLLLLICIIAVLLWCMSRQKGSYVTNETDGDDEVDDDDNRSVGSDAELQCKEPLKTKEDE